MINAEPTLSIEVLRAQVQGTVIVPGDLNYDAARQGWNLSFDQYPAVILIANNATDIALGIQYARAHNLGVSVQATGHGTILNADDCLLILTSELLDVFVDAESQTAWVEAGVMWSAVLEKAQAVGLTPLIGSSSGVGAVSYTLGGGMGWLARKYGLSVDSVLEFEVVTADGQLRHASETENPDLFWALCGGGKGIFGVVTAMRIRLYPVTTVYAGSVMYPLADAKEVFAFYREWIKYLPTEWTTSISVMHFPPLPELPPFLSGQSMVMVTGCYSGDVKIGQMMAQALVDWRQPIANTFAALPMSQQDRISNDPMDPTAGRVSGAWLSDISDETVDLLLEHVGSPTGAFVLAEIRYAGGAIANVPAWQNAYDHRSETQLLHCVGITPTAEAVQQFGESVRALKQALGSHLSGGVYMNFLEGHEAHNETAKAFAAEKYQRLSEAKAKYDPDNLFRFGFNIPVAGK